MKILLTVHADLDRNAGAASVILRLKDEFERQGHHVETISFDDVDWASRRFREILLPFLVAWRFAARYRRFDVVDTSTGDAWLAFKLPARAGGPLRVVHSHGLETLLAARELAEARASGATIPFFKRFWRYGLRLWQVKAAYRGADLAFVLNEAERAALVASGVLPRRIRRSPLGMSLPVLQAVPVRAADRFAMIQLGSYTLRKGKAVTATAVSRLLRDYPEATMTFAGTGVDRKTVHRDYDQALHGRIHVIASYSNDQLPDILADKTVLLMPSLFEGYGIAKIEAMARGVVPVVSDDPGTANDMVDGVNALVVPVGDADALAAAIGRLHDDADLVRRLATNGLETARAAQWSAAAEQRLRVYAAFLHAPAGMAGRLD